MTSSRDPLPARPAGSDPAPGPEPVPGPDRAPRVVLVLPSTTYRATDFLEAARAVGAQVVVASDGSQALKATMGAGALTVPVDDPDRAGARIAAHTATGPIDAVVGVDDRGVRAAAAASARLGLPHNPPEAVMAAARKDRQRAALAAAGVPQPRFALVGADDDAAAAAAQVGPPCVVKPTTRSGSQGVLRADTPAEAAQAAARIRAIVAAAGDDPDQPLLVEAFAPGAEVAVEGLVRGGVLEVLAVFDKPDHPDGPTFEETVYVTPSRTSPAALAALEAVVADAAAALGLVEGPIHAEARVDPGSGRVVVLEVAARSIGGLCSRALRFGAGVSLEEVVVRHALGLDADAADRPRRELSAAGVLMVPIPERGVLAGVDGVDDARALPGVHGVEISIGPGQEVVPVPEGDRYLGFAFARGPTPGDVEATLRAVQHTLRVRVRAATPRA